MAAAEAHRMVKLCELGVTLVSIERLSVVQ